MTVGHWCIGARPDAPPGIEYLGCSDQTKTCGGTGALFAESNPSVISQAPSFVGTRASSLIFSVRRLHQHRQRPNLRLSQMRWKVHRPADHQLCGLRRLLRVTLAPASRSVGQSALISRSPSSVCSLCIPFHTSVLWTDWFTKQRATERGRWPCSHRVPILGPSSRCL